MYQVRVSKAGCECAHPLPSSVQRAPLGKLVLLRPPQWYPSLGRLQELLRVTCRLQRYGAPEAYARVVHEEVEHSSDRPFRWCVVARTLTSINRGMNYIVHDGMDGAVREIDNEGDINVGLLEPTGTSLLQREIGDAGLDRGGVVDQACVVKLLCARRARESAVRPSTMHSPAEEPTYKQAWGVSALWLWRVLLFRLCFPWTNGGPRKLCSVVAAYSVGSMGASRGAVIEPSPRPARAAGRSERPCSCPKQYFLEK